MQEQPMELPDEGLGPTFDLMGLSQHIEAVIFAAGEPMTVAQLRRVLRRAPLDLSAVCQDAGPSADDDAPAGGDADVAASDALAATIGPAEAQPESSASVVESAEGAEASSPEAPALLDGELPAVDEPAFALEAEPNDAPCRDPRPKTLSQAIRAAIALVERRWSSVEQACGFTFVEVAGGYSFRTRAAFGSTVACLKEERPARLSRPAMESLAIVAYRQPVTKPEVDALRGVDCGGTLKVLLDRRLIGVVGKKEEPGRPLLYGTTEAFLSMFNLANLAALPSLREFNELNVDSEDALRAFDGLPSLAELSAGQKQFRMDEAPSIEALDAAVERLKDTEGSTRSMLLEHGVRLADGDEAPAGPSAANEPGQRPRPSDGAAPAAGHDTMH